MAKEKRAKLSLAKAVRTSEVVACTYLERERMIENRKEKERERERERELCRVGYLTANMMAACLRSSFCH